MVIKFVLLTRQGLSQGTDVFTHQVSFATSNDQTDLIIKAKKPHESTVLELIPHKLFADDLPIFLVDEYAHWLDLARGVVEFRPLAKQWEYDGLNWQLSLGLHDIETVLPATMIKWVADAATKLVDNCSTTFNAIAQVLSPFEQSQYLTISRNTSHVLVELPRYRLVFFVNDQQQLECQSLRNMVIDDDSRIGTLVGLQTRLLLRVKQENARNLPRSRVVLIPHGEVVFAPRNHHVHVSIGTAKQRNVTFHEYKIDEDLGYLVCTSSLQSRLYKTYLHAVTSHCLVDPLLGRTGTEEALHELSLGATISFKELERQEADLLKLIGDLTPDRVWYPPHLKRMQTVHWSPLSPLVQHDAFRSSTQAIFKFAQKLQVLLKHGLGMDEYITVRSEDLSQRASQRDAVYWPQNTSGHSAQRLPRIKDVILDNRDVSKSGSSALWASQLICRLWMNRDNHTQFPLTSTIQSWKAVSQWSTRHTLCYTSEWLRPSLSKSWISLYDCCRRANNPGHPWQMAFSVSSMAYGSQDLLGFVPVFLVIATNPAFERISPPQHSKAYDLCDGYQPTIEKTLECVSSGLYRLVESPAQDLPRGIGETDAQLRARRLRYYATESAEFVERLVERFLLQWPCDEVAWRNLPAEYNRWFVMTTCGNRVQSYFNSCSRNAALRLHLQEVESVLRAGPSSPGATIPSFSSSVPSWEVPQAIPSSQSSSSVDIYDVMKDSSPPELQPLGLFVRFDTGKRRPHALVDQKGLESLLLESDFQDPLGHTLRHRFGQDLEASRQALQQRATPLQLGTLPPLKALHLYHDMHYSHLGDTFGDIERALLPGPSRLAERCLAVSGLWPRVTPRTILGLLAFSRRQRVPNSWKEAFVAMAQALVEYQCSQRLYGFALDCKIEEFFKEIDSCPSEESEDESFDTDWLLIQVKHYLLSPDICNSWLIISRRSMATFVPDPLNSK